MRGDQLSRQWRTIRAIEASLNGLTVAEIAKREDSGIRTIYRDLGALQSAGFPLYTERAAWSNRWAIIDFLNFNTPPAFIPSLDRDEYRVFRHVYRVYPTVPSPFYAAVA